MKTNWKDNLKEKNNQELVKLFSVKKRINIEPQLYAANLLFYRGFYLDELKQIKHDLISTINKDFQNKFNTGPRKIIN